MRKTLITAAVMLGLAVAATAQVVTLTNQNSVVTINTTQTASNSSAGMNSWTVDGINELFQQVYYYRIGETGGEQVVNRISTPTNTLFGTNSANIQYSNTQVRVDINYTLIGGAVGSGTSDVSEVTRITNISAAPFTMHLFEYDDFDLGTSFSDDRAELVNSSTIRQFDAQTNALVGTLPVPSHWQIAQSGVIDGSLQDTNPTTLTDTGSPFGPGDATFAFQWDVTIAAGDTFLMSKNKIIDQVIPEPVSLLSLGAFGTLKADSRLMIRKEGDKAVEVVLVPAEQPKKDK